MEFDINSWLGELVKKSEELKANSRDEYYRIVGEHAAFCTVLAKLREVEGERQAAEAASSDQSSGIQETKETN
jgi:hypothetical protein